MREHCPHCAYTYEVVPAQCALCHRRLRDGLRLPFIGRAETIKEIIALAEEVKRAGVAQLVGVSGSSGGGVGALIQQVSLRLSRPPYGFRQVSAHPFTLNVTRTPARVPMVFQRLLESMFRVDLQESAQDRERWVTRQLRAMSPPRAVVDAFFKLWGEPTQRQSSSLLALSVDPEVEDDEDDEQVTIELSNASEALSELRAQHNSLSPLHDDEPTHPPAVQVPEISGLTELTRLISFFAQRAPVTLSFYDLQSAPQRDLEAINALARALESSGAPVLMLFERPSAAVRPLLTLRRALNPLSFQDLTELLSEAFPYAEEPIASVERLMKRSAGHPAAVIQALMQASSGGGVTLKGLKRSRPPIAQGGVEGSIRELLTFASMIGPTFSLSQVYLVARSFETRPWSELPPKKEDYWRELLHVSIQEGVVAQTRHQRMTAEPSYRFRSTDLKEGYARLWSGQYHERDRTYAHRLLAEWMSTQEYTPEAQVQVGLSIAEHWRAGGAPLEASRVSLEVGELLLKKGNHKLAYSALQQADQLLEGRGLWRQLRRLYTLLARASAYLGLPHEAESILQQALKRAWQLDDLSAAYELGQQLYELYKTRGFDSQATSVGEWLSSLPREAQYERGRGEGALFDTFDARAERARPPMLYDLPLHMAPQPATRSAPSVPPSSSPQLLFEAELPLPNTRTLAMNHISDLEPPPPPVMQVLNTLQLAGYEAWVVGGSVRDRLLGRTVSDWDLTTSAEPAEVSACFKKVIETGIEHGTVTVIQEGVSVEVTTYRVDGVYLDGRRPEEVTFTRSLTEDLARRDFTINAMAWDPNQKRLEDPFGGASDLQRAQIRAVGKPLDRLREDGLRSLRAVRFASTLGFEIEPDTWEAIKGSLDVFQGVAMERVQVELFKTLLSAEAGRGLEALRQSQMLAHIAPELDALANESFSLLCDALGRTSAQLETRLALLFSCCLSAESVAQRRLTALKSSKKLTQQVTHLLRWLEVRPSTERTDGQIRALVAQVGLSKLPGLISYRRALAEAAEDSAEAQAWLDLQERAAQLKVHESPQSPRDLALRGSELALRFGLPPSKAIGELLNALLHHVWEHPEDNQVERLIALTPTLARELGIEVHSP